jgi:hypothetical protein
MRRQAHAAQVGNDYGVILCQHFSERYPQVAGVAEAVKQHDRGPRSADANVLRTVADRHLLGTERSRPEFDVGKRRRRGEQRYGGKIAGNPTGSG